MESSRASKNFEKLSEREFEIPAKDITDLFSGNIQPNNQYNFSSVCSAIQCYVINELRSFGMNHDLDSMFFVELLKNSYDAYNASEAIKKGEPLKIKINLAYSEASDSILLKFKDNAIGFANIAKGKAIIFKDEKAEDYQRKNWTTQRLGGFKKGLRAIRFFAEENFGQPLSMSTKNRKEKGSSIHFEAPMHAFKKQGM